MSLVVCPECRKQVSSSASSCPNCGFRSGKYPGRSKGVAVLFALLLGGLGIHKFYLGRTATGFLYLIFCWTFIPALLGLVDALVLMLKPKSEFGGVGNQKVTKFEGDGQGSKSPMDGFR